MAALAARVGRMNSAAALHVLLADDHAMVRDGLRSLIEVDWPEAHFTEARDQPGVLDALLQTPPPDLAVVDVRMPGMRGAASFAEFRRCNAATAMVVVTGLDDPGLTPSLLALGAAAVVSKEASGDTLLSALHQALAAHGAEPSIPPVAVAKTVAASKTNQGSRGLSDRQRDMLRLLHEGLPNKLIARRLDIAGTTVKDHLHGLCEALAVRGRVEAIGLTRDWLL